MIANSKNFGLQVICIGDHAELQSIEITNYERIPGTLWMVEI